MQAQELQSKVLDYLSKNVDKEYFPVVKVEQSNVGFIIQVYIVGEITSKKDIYIGAPIIETYSPLHDDLDCVLDYIASEIRMHEIEDNRRYDETGASY